MRSFPCGTLLRCAGRKVSVSILGQRLMVYASRSSKDDDGQWRTSSLAQEGIRRNERDQTDKLNSFIRHVKPTRVWGRFQNPAGQNEG